MPRELEEAFDEAGVPLFPRRSSDLATECSCPDWSNPCKHIAAVYYLVAEEFDRIPFWRDEADPTKLLTAMIERAGPLGVEVLAGGEGAGAAEAGPG